MLRQFEDVLVYLKSIAEFLKDDDNFNWNYGIATAASGDYKTGEEALMSIQSESFRLEYAFHSVARSVPHHERQSSLSMGTILADGYER